MATKLDIFRRGSWNRLPINH